ncbi:hypothetical protein AERO8C_30082 [Aeromonas veronii]|uniref:Uncharacterized protein n=1 Tax=Aeromonas veronii TaxID=654 RepID=A0A653L4A1_AERVE|nr:hypothetical protein AERO8C_30082 [Aeromonas veronii]
MFYRKITNKKGIKPSSLTCIKPEFFS